MRDRIQAIGRQMMWWTPIVVVATMGAFTAWAQNSGPPELPIKAGECWDIDANGKPVQTTVQYLLDHRCDRDVRDCLNVPDPYACQPHAPSVCGNDCQYWAPQGHVYTHGQCRNTRNLQDTCVYCFDSYLVCASGWKYKDSGCSRYCSRMCYRWVGYRDRCKAGLQRRQQSGGGGE